MTYFASCARLFALIVSILSVGSGAAGERTQRETSLATVSDADTADERKFQDALFLRMQRLVDWQISDESWSEFANRLRKELDAEVLVDELALEDIDVDVGETVNGHYERISLQQALEHLLNQRGLDWSIQGRALVISSKEVASEQLVVRVYDVRDLVVTGNFRQMNFDQLIDVIISQVATETWAENGGGESEIRGFNVDGINALVVTQTFRVQRQIEQLFSDLRRLRGTSGVAAQPTIGWSELQAKLKLIADELIDDENSPADDAVPTPLLLGSPSFEDAIARCNEFSLDLFREAAGDQRGNQLISGYGLREMLALASFGSKGATRQQLEKGLRLKSSRQANALESLSIRNQLRDASIGSEFLVANGVWVQRELELDTKFTSLAEKFMNATIAPVDFRESAATAKMINEWAAANTRNRIPKVVDDELVAASEPCLLANAIYFLGKWEMPFKIEQTTASDFRLATGERVKVPMMHGQMIASGGIDEETGVTIGELFYENESTSMAILLPADRKGAMEEVVQTLTHEKLQRWLGELGRGTIRVELPKFRIEAEYDLQAVITELGMRDAFDPARADFSGIAAQPLFLQQVRQFTFIQVDEAGTEAAAVTTGAFGRPTRAVTDVIVDRPFLFLIRDVKTGCILFMGRMVDPRAESGNR